MSARKRYMAFVEAGSNVAASMQRLIAAIDALGDLAVEAGGGEQCDMLACYASNTIQGSAALIKDMLDVVRLNRRKKPATPEPR